MLGEQAAGGSVVVAVDSSAHQLQAVAWGALEAASRGMALRLVRSFVPEPLRTPLGADSFADGHIARAARRLLANAAAYAHAVAPSVRVSATLPAGSATRQFASAVGKPALVVVGHTDGDRLGGSPFGSTGMALIGCTTCPMAVVRTSIGWDRSAQAPVVLSLGDEYPPPVNEDVLEYAFLAAERRKVPVVAVEAGENYETTAILRTVSERFPDIKVCRHIVGEHTSRALVDWTRDAQLLVLGSHPDEGVGELAPGSAARTAVDFARCPVVLVRPRPAEVTDAGDVSLAPRNIMR
ncbi:universal stress protein [Fodinicola acaciae]|uniref:universal stress protein n=1 Tax=Fodinicola acaciae TaxID=2681555 RepID=UPI0013CF543F|nr:universal stress protein [Fodinicola acaciae]